MLHAAGMRSDNAHTVLPALHFQLGHGGFRYHLYQFADFINRHG